MEQLEGGGEMGILHIVTSVFIFHNDKDVALSKDESEHDSTCILL